jgi:hypothetical protein
MLTRNLKIFFLLLIFKPSFSQVSKLKLEIITEIYLSNQKDSDLKSILFENENLGTYNVINNICYIKTINGDFKLIPEKYNIGINVIKNAEDKIIGLTKKKKDQSHIIGFQNRVFKLEGKKNSNQYKLKELQDQDEQQISFPKRIILHISKNSEMDLYHNLDNIPPDLLPIIANTKNTNNRISKIKTASIFASAALIVIDILLKPKNNK